MQVRLFTAAILMGMSLASAAPEPGDLPLSLPYALKASVPFLMLPTALDDGDDVLLVDLLLFGAMTVPNSMTLYNAWAGNPRQARFWRKTTFALDLGMTAGMLGYGLYGMSKLDDDGPDGFESLGMGLVILACIPAAAITLLDLIPFSAEQNVGITAAPILVPGAKGPEAGAFAAIQVRF